MLIKRFLRALFPLLPAFLSIARSGVKLNGRSILLNRMSFDTYFRVSSYATIAVAMLALVLAGGLHVGLAAGFAAFMVLSWRAEGSKWQLSERVGLFIVLLSVPLFFLDWQFQKALGEPIGRLGVSSLAHLIVFLSAIKLLQSKADRDWVFLYLISFFELLLAAGLSFSPLFLLTLSLYLLCALSTVIAFEIRKARRSIKSVETRLLVPPDSRIFRRVARRRGKSHFEANRLPLTSFGLLFLIFVVALPLFLIAPRAGSAVLSRGGAGMSGFVGFSENVSLGEIGSLKQNDQVVMRVRIDEVPPDTEQPLRWRGVALDYFTGRGWRKSAEARRSEQKFSERGFFQIGTTEALHRLTTQTVFLEPLDTTVLFSAPRTVAIQGDLPFVRVDPEGSIQSRRHDLDRLIYKAFSDTNEPEPQILRRDMRQYPASLERYLQLPTHFDPRITSLANAMIVNAHARNRYDAARAIEQQLQSGYGYTLNRRAGGEDPLADFLFNVRAGHCEYFSTAMAVMLRTHGIATRVVNGFLPGEYNEAAGAYTVRQSDAHSWVEVYFPDTNSWVTFDPTPAAGRTEPLRTGIAAQLGKYAEALELIWFQYVVGYDKQEQRTLVTSLHNRLFQYQRLLADTLSAVSRTPQAVWNKRLVLVLLILLAAFAIFMLLRLKRSGWTSLRKWRRPQESERSGIEFYQRLMKLLAERGINRSPDQTPLEFATGTGLDMLLRITHAYHRVRYGTEQLSRSEIEQIEHWLREMEEQQEFRISNFELRI